MKLYLLIFSKPPGVVCSDLKYKVSQAIKALSNYDKTFDILNSVKVCDELAKPNNTRKIFTSTIEKN